MLDAESVAEALVRPDVTVAKLAPAVGTVSSAGPFDYRVKTNDPAVLEVSLGIPEGKDGSAAPSFVEFYYSREHSVALAEAVPGCKGWRLIPGNPSGSPYLYACRFAGSDERVEVNFVATLDHEIASQDARMVTLILQRNVW
jgi:hypothetical protein